jgi:hypothetical protein
MLFSKATLMVLSIAASANGQVNLGTASAYGVFGGTTVTNTGLTVVNARVGLSPGVSITGFPPGISDGQDISNDVATQAKADIQAAYNAAAGLATTKSLTGTDLGGQILPPGVYTFASSGGLTGILTLDGGGDANAQFVFQFGSTITTATASSVVLINGAQACNVFWQVGSSATLGTGTLFVGNVLAFTSITATTGVSVRRGGLYALGGAVTLDTNLIDVDGACGAPAPVPSPSSTSAIVIAVPPVTVSVPTDDVPTLPVTVTIPPVTVSVPTDILTTPLITVVVPTSIFSTTTTTQTPPVVTTTTTSTVTNPASTTTITISVPVTITQSVQVSTITVTSTTTKYSTKSSTKTASATKCPTKASSTKSSKTSTKAQNYKRAKASTKTKTVTTTCAKYTKTHQATQTVKATKAHTSTVWHTKSATTTSTVTHQPTCTNAPKAKRDYERMFG